MIRVFFFLSFITSLSGGYIPITLSSTHLPWLSSYFQKIIPEAKLYDPSDDLVKAIKNHISEGEGKIHSIISESEKYPADEFLKILDILKIKLDYEII